MLRNLVLSRVRRYRMWNELLTAAEAEGIEVQSLHRVGAFIDSHCKVGTPRYSNADQRPWKYFPGLAARPIHDRSAFPWAVQLEQHFEAIRDEVLIVRAASQLKSHHQNLLDQGKWDTLYFQAAGLRVDGTYAACPATGRLVDAIPTAGSAGQVYFSVLGGGTHINPHYGPTNVRLRCHFGIVVPPDSRIRVGSEIVSWPVGGCLFFDDSFEHEVWNPGHQERIVLIIDVWHPDLTEEEKWAIEYITSNSGSIKNYRQGAAAA